MRSAEASLVRTVDDADFDEFFLRNVERARRMAWRLVGGDDAAAADVVQEAFLRAYKGLNRFRGESGLDTWFYRIVVNEAASYRRRSWMRRAWREAVHGTGEYVKPSMDGHDVPLEACATQIPLTDPALRLRICTAMKCLSGGQLQAFILVHLENYTVSEAAQLLGVSEGTIKKQLHRALLRLRHELGDLR